jgi:hypothetical protein
LAELREKRKKIQRAPIFAAAFVVTTILLLAAQLPLWLTLLFVGAFVWVDVLMVRSDYETKLAVLNYDFDSDARGRYVKLLGALQSLANSARIWRVIGEQRSRDTKYTSGAHRLMDKKSVSLRLATPKFVTTTLAVWEMSLGNQSLYFFPDRILIYQGSEVGAIQYGSVDVAATQVAFIESGGVPSDSQVIGQTWRYVNKKGGPDRRFSYNPQIPIAKYGELTIRSNSGINFVLQCSNPDRASDFKEGIEAYTRQF